MFHSNTKKTFYNIALFIILTNNHLFFTFILSSLYLSNPHVVYFVINRYVSMSSHGFHLQRGSHRRGPVHLYPPRPILPKVVQHHSSQDRDPMHLDDR